MKKIFWLITPVLLFSIHAYSQVHISGGLSGVFEDTIYIVDDDIFVNNGDGMVIEPGAVFLFDGNYIFEINGTLISQGAEDDSIYFLPNEGVESWRGIQFNDFSTYLCMMEYCFITGSNDSGIKCLYSSPQISRCTITGNSAVNGGGIYCKFSSSVIERCSITDNTAEYGGGLYLWRFSPVIKYCLVEGNYAQRSGGGLQSWFCDPSIQNCTFEGNTAILGAGVNLEYSEANMVNCIVSNSVNGSGVNFTNSDESRIDYCDFFNNQAGNFLGTTIPGLGIIIQTNANEDSCDAFSNILLDPLYINPEFGNYGISWVSPCIDAGNPLTAQDPDNTTADMGAIYFDQNGPNPPMPFNLISPAYGDTSSTGNILLQWENSVDPDNALPPYFDVWMDTLPALSTKWLVYDSVATPELYISGLEDDKDYYWTVRATDSNTPGTWANDTLMFRTFIPENLLPFSLLQPGDGAMLTQNLIMFRWEASVDPDPNDIVTYTIWFKSGSDSISYYAGANTQYYKNIYTIPIISPLTITEWYVIAHSSFPENILECEARYTFVAPLDAPSQNENAGIPDTYILLPIFPNPFNSSAIITFGLPEKSEVKISIFDITGREVSALIDSEFSAGYHSVKWNAEDSVTGIYFVRLMSDRGENRVMKIMLLR